MGSSGTLLLDHSSDFSGTVAGMSGQDTIDFADINFTTPQAPSYSGTSSGGTLTVTDGAHTANVALLGNYLASTFVASSDGHGGTSVIQVPSQSSANDSITHPQSWITSRRLASGSRGGTPARVGCNRSTWHPISGTLPTVHGVAVVG